MTFTILIFSYRKTGTTPEEFRVQCEGTLLPLLKEITGTHFPLCHTRRYIQRTEGPKADSNTERNPTTPATVFVGSQADFDYDAIAELTFADQAAFGRFIGLMQQPDNAAKIAEAEGKFTDSGKTSIVAVGETAVTRNE
ncbi:EthD domain-containing protein [Lipomyces tetrasporus]